MSRLLALYYEFRYRLRKWYWSRNAHDSRINGVVLMYHHISDVRMDELDTCQHTLEQFKKSLECYINQSYIFVNIDTALKMIREKSEQKFAVVTFDDVPLDAYEKAVPVLLSMQIPFTFFITTGYIGTEGFMTAAQLKKLDNQELCTIGAHTKSHPMLRKVSNSFEELKESKEILERLLGHPVDYLAYPFGRQSSISHKVMKQAEKAGYKCAFGTIAATINDLSSKSLYYLPRIVRK